MMKIKKTGLSFLILVLGVASIIYGIYRGEAYTVFSKASKICLECVGIG